jgi:hypothetical protein
MPIERHSRSKHNVDDLEVGRFGRLERKVTVARPGSILYKASMPYGVTG